MDVNLEQEQRQNLAAGIIQSRWREYSAKKAAANGENDFTQQDPAHELTEEEQKENLLAHIRSLLSEREALISRSLNQQRSLSKVFADRRSNTQETSGGDASAEAETKYWEQVNSLRDKRVELERKRDDADEDLGTTRNKHEALLDEVLREEIGFRQYVRDTAMRCKGPRGAQQINDKFIAKWEKDEEIISQKLQDARITYLRQRNKAKKLTAELKHKEQVNDGLHLIDFEQLKIENTNLNEKIEERNEDLLKLRKKATTTIHILTHVKEKQEFVKAENVQLNKQVKQLDDTLGELRDTLATRKKDRDVFVNENLRMKEKMPMIGSEDLLLDFELRKKEIENLRIEVLSLTNQHHELMGWISDHQGQLEKLQRAASTQ